MRPERFGRAVGPPEVRPRRPGQDPSFRPWPWDAADVEAQWPAPADLLYRNTAIGLIDEETVAECRAWLDGLERLWLAMLAPLDV